jgi:hypothetical protein
VKLDLTVSATGENYLAVGSPISQVTGIVKTVVGYERIIAKYLLSKLGEIAVTATYAFTANEKTSASSDGKRIHPSVKDV